MKFNFLISTLFLLFLSACATNSNNQQNKQTQQIQQTQTAQKFNRLWKKISWQDLPNWKFSTQNDNNLQQSWNAFLLSCKAWKNQQNQNNEKSQQWKTWQNICNNAQQLAINNNKEIIDFFENNFSAYEVINGNNPNANGTLTGYYEPLLYGSFTKTNRYKYAIYGEPENLLTIDFAELFDIYPELKNKRLRGRLDKNSKKILPYWNRQQLAEFEKTQDFANTGKPLLFVDDDVALFFLQIQGSGRIQLENGNSVRVGYANQNGQPYQSIGRILVKQNELPLSQASMQGIQRWIKNNPSKKQWLFNQNPSFVFFKINKEISANDGAIGALGVPLTTERSIAIDPRAVPLGTPIFMNTQILNQATNRLVMAQDTGGAIKGEIRADLFCGFGSKAGELAGSMNQPLKIWALFPKNLTAEQLPK